MREWTLRHPGTSVMLLLVTWVAIGTGAVLLIGPMNSWWLPSLIQLTITTVGALITSWLLWIRE